MYDLYRFDRLAAADSELEFAYEVFVLLFGPDIGPFHLVSLVETEEAGTTTSLLTVAATETVLLSIPGLESVAAGIVRDESEEDSWPLILVELARSDTSTSLGLKHFPLRIMIDNPYLVPEPIEGFPPTLPGFSFELEGSIKASLGDDGVKVTGDLESFTVPPFRILGTGAVIAIEECQLIFTEDDVPDDIDDFGFDNEFRGLITKKAFLSWELPILLTAPNTTMTGIDITLTEVAIGNQGVTGKGEASWEVEHLNGNFIAEETELFGYLVTPGWDFAAESASLTVKDSVPIGSTVSGFVRLPFLDTIVRVALAWTDDELPEEESGPTSFLGVISQASTEPIVIGLGGGAAVELRELSAGGGFDTDGAFTFNGQAQTTLAIDGVTSSTAVFGCTFEHSGFGDKLEVALDDVTIAGIGGLSNAELILEWDSPSDSDDNPTEEADGLRSLDSAADSADDVFGELSSALVKGTVSWSDLRSRVNLVLPEGFPTPPDTATATLVAIWQNDALQLHVEFEVEDPHTLWAFIPEPFRPEVASAKLSVKLIAVDDEYTGEVGVTAKMRLPDPAAFPGLADLGLDQLVMVESGDSEGFVTARFVARIDSETAVASVEAAIEDPLTMRFAIPGLELPAPPLEVQVTKIAVTGSADQDDDELKGTIELVGDVVLRPILPRDLGDFVPSIMSQHLERLLAPLHLGDIRGEASLNIDFNKDDLTVKLSASFAEAEIELDLFDMITGAVGLGDAVIAGSSGAPTADGSEIDLDLDVSFGLQAISIMAKRSKPAGSQTAEVELAFSIGAVARVAGQAIEFEFALSPEELSFGIVELPIPIALPPLPMTSSDLEVVTDPTGRWSLAQWADVESTLDDDLEKTQALLDKAESELKDLERNAASVPDAPARIRELRFRTIPPLRKALLVGIGKKFMMDAVLAIYDGLGRQGESAQNTYQSLVTAYQYLTDNSVGLVAGADSDLSFVVSDVKFSLPFDDPANLRVEGGATIQGFDPDHVLAPLGDLEFRLGISPEAIFFSVEGGPDPIPLPSFGRYPGSGIVLDHISFGYGYSKNSLLVDVAGALLLSPQLVEDADTSDSIGAGIILPTASRVQFKLDLIPVVLGEADFVLPLIAFDIDLRSEVAPLAATADSPCSPAWDGLQLNIPGIVRADAKRAKFSPFFGPVPAAHSLYSFDLDVGTASIGTTYVCENYQTMVPVNTATAIPFLVDGSPFFDRLCMSVRVAGFEITCDLSRPFPSPDPLAIFELFGFLSAPQLNIDPAGALANLVWAQLTNARLSLPPAGAALFPGAAGVINQDFSYRVNLATVLAIAGQIKQLGESTLELIDETVAGTQDLIARFENNPPALPSGELLQTLPRDLRRIDLEGSFIGFDANATLMIVDPRELLDTVTGQEPPPQPPDPGPDPGGQDLITLVDESFASGLLQNWEEIANPGTPQDGWLINRQRVLAQTKPGGDRGAAALGTMIVHDTPVPASATIEAKVWSVESGGTGLVFSVSGATTFYRFRMLPSEQLWILDHVEGGHATQLHRSTGPKVGTKHHVRIQLDQAETAVAPSRLPGRPVRPSDARIQIWVDEIPWVDTKVESPLPTGRAGFDCWMSTDGQFDDFSIKTPKLDSGLVTPVLPIGIGGRETDVTGPATVAGNGRLTRLGGRSAIRSTSRSLEKPPFAALPPASELLDAAGQPPVFGTAARVPLSGPAWSALDIDGFEPEDIIAALADADALAILVAAEIRVFDTQKFRFLGSLGSDGSFLLSTAADIKPLHLSIAGINAVLPVSVASRLTVAGRSAGAESWARVTGQLYGVWDLIPGLDANRPIARVVVGNETNPATLGLASNGNFTVAGAGNVELFNGAIEVSGSIDASQAHCFATGQTSFKPNLFIDGTRLLEVVASGEGRIGPGAQFDLALGGSLTILGRPIATSTLRITDEGLRFGGSLAGSGSWQLAGFTFSKMDLAIAGGVSFSSNGAPAAQLDATGSLEVLGAEIAGSLAIAAEGTDWSLAASGALSWMGREWANAALELSNDSISISGATDIRVDLTTPGLEKVGGVSLGASLAGSFDLSADGGLQACDLEVGLDASIRLSGMADGQGVSIIAKRLSVNVPNAVPDAEGIVTLRTLIDVETISLLPESVISVPIPTLGDETNYYLGETTRTLDPPGPITIKSLSTVGPDNSTEPFIEVGLPLFTPLELWKVDIVIGESFEVDVPSITTEGIDEDLLFSVPELGASDLREFFEILELGLKVDLVWKDGGLGLRVNNGQVQSIAPNPGNFLIVLNSDIGVGSSDTVGTPQ